MFTEIVIIHLYYIPILFTFGCKCGELFLVGDVLPACIYNTLYFIHMHACMMYIKQPCNCVLSSFSLILSSARVRDDRLETQTHSAFVWFSIHSQALCTCLLQV